MKLTLCLPLVFVTAWIREITRAMKIEVDFHLGDSQPSQAGQMNAGDTLLRSVGTHVILGLIGCLGFEGHFKPQPFAAGFARVALRCRNVVWTVTAILQTSKTIRTNTLDEPSKSCHSE